MMYEKENKMLAEACDVELDCAGYYIQRNMPKALDQFVLWDLRDARCREVIRERFGIETKYSHLMKDWFCLHPVSPDMYGGKTIAEAEIACIVEICRGLEVMGG